MGGGTEQENPFALFSKAVASCKRLLDFPREMLVKSFSFKGTGSLQRNTGNIVLKLLQTHFLSIELIKTFFRLDEHTLIVFKHTFPSFLGFARCRMYRARNINECIFLLKNLKSSVASPSGCVCVGGGVRRLFYLLPGGEFL